MKKGMIAFAKLLSFILTKLSMSNPFLSQQLED